MAARYLVVGETIELVSIIAQQPRELAERNLAVSGRLELDLIYLST